jgi:hypothetical protein
LSARSYGTPELPAVFPDWSPYRDLDAACRAYLRDPDVALDALGGVLRRSGGGGVWRSHAGGEDGVFGFTLERFVNEVNGVWQEVAVCDGDRLVLWHGEDVPPDDGPYASSGAGSAAKSTGSSAGQRGGSGGAGLGAGALSSSLRVVPLSSITEVGCRRRLVRTQTGQIRVESVDVYLLLATLDEGAVAADPPVGAARHDALRFGKTLEDGGLGQIARVEEFARLIASQLGSRRAP